MTFDISVKLLYADFIKRGIGQETQSHDLKYGSHEGRFLGTDEFVQKTIFQDPSLSSMPSYSLQDLLDIVCNKLEIPLTVILNPGKQRISTTARGIAALLIKNTSHLTLKAFADFVDQDLSALSKLVDRTQHKSKFDPMLNETIESLKKQLTSF